MIQVELSRAVGDFFGGEMRHAMRILLASIAVVAGFALAQPAGPVGAPTMKAGDAWTFRVTDRLERVDEAKKVTDRLWEVVRVDDKGYEVRITTKGNESSPFKRIYSHDGALLVAGTLQFDPAQPVLNFPLEQGKKWSGYYKFVNAASRTVDAQLFARAVGWESVTVPAGTFTAMKIEYSGQWGVMFGNFRAGGEYDRAGWYVPELRQFVRFESKTFGPSGRSEDVVSELVSFKLAN